MFRKNKTYYRKVRMEHSEVTRRNVAVGSRISWGAIIAGAFLALVVNIMLLSLGSGIGFTVYDPGQGDELGMGSLIGGGIYTILVVCVSLFVGGFVASRLAGTRSIGVAGLHGLCTWALVTTFASFMVVTGIGNAVGAAFSLVGQGLGGAAQAGFSMVEGMDVDMEALQGEVRKTMEQTGKPELDPERLEGRAEKAKDRAADATADQGAQAGREALEQEGEKVTESLDQEALANVLSKRMNISKEEAQSMIAQGREGLEVAQERVQEIGTRAAEVSTTAAAAASWITFFVLLGGGLSAYFGGYYGERYKNSL